MDALVPVGTSLVGAVVGALATHLYRDYRDRPILRITLEELRRARRPIRLPDQIYDCTAPLGTFHRWLNGVVRWDADRVFDDNRFTLRQLRDIRNLIPQFLSQQKESLRRTERMRAAIAPAPNPLTPEARYALSCVRHSWQEAFREDVFIAYSKDANRVAGELVANLDGDLHQHKFTIEGVKKLSEYLEKGLSPDADERDKLKEQPEEPQTPLKPFLILDLQAQNIGKTETVLTDRAELNVASTTFQLKGLGEIATFDVFAGKFFSVKAASVAPLRFGQDPDNTTQAELVKLADLLKAGTHKARVVVADISGKRWKSDQFSFCERLDAH